jgi:hypothetical protein
MDGSLSDTPDCDARYDLVNAHSLSFLGVHHVSEGLSLSGMSQLESKIYIEQVSQQRGSTMPTRGRSRAKIFWIVLTSLSALASGLRSAHLI